MTEVIEGEGVDEFRVYLRLGMGLLSTLNTVNIPNGSGSHVHSLGGLVPWKTVQKKVVLSRVPGFCKAYQIGDSLVGTFCKHVYQSSDFGAEGIVPSGSKCCDASP